MAIVLLTVPLTAFAGGENEYHYDATAFYSREEIDTLDINGWGASFECYWNPVTYSDLYPNKEAVFINRLGSIGVRYWGQNYNISGSDTLITEFDTALVLADKGSSHIFQIDYGYGWLSSDASYFLTDNEEVDKHHINFGHQYYLLNNLTVGGNFSINFFDDSYSKQEQYIYKIHSKYLLDFGNQNWAGNRFLDGDDMQKYTIAINYLF